MKHFKTCVLLEKEKFKLPARIPAVLYALTYHESVSVRIEVLLIKFTI